MVQEVLAQGTTVYGQSVKVTKETHREPLKGVGQESYAVTVGTVEGRPGGSFGFASLEDAKRFVFSGKETDYKGFDRDGNEIKNRRTGLGVPRGMMTDFPSSK